VRAPKLTEEDMVALPVGTQERPRVEGARPGLFGEAEPPAGSAPEPAPAEPPAAAPASAEANPLSASSAMPSAAPASPAGVPGPNGLPAAEAPGADSRPVTVLFSPPEVSLRVGQTAGVAVVLVGARDVQWVEVIVGFDPALAELTEMGPGSLLTLDGTAVSAERQIEAGRARVRFLRSTATSGSGAVAAITLRGVKPGSGAIAIESIAIGRASGTERPAVPVPARLVVTP